MHHSSCYSLTRINKRVSCSIRYIKYINVQSAMKPSDLQIYSLESPTVVKWCAKWRTTDFAGRFVGLDRIRLNWETIVKGEGLQKAFGKKDMWDNTKYDLYKCHDSLKSLKRLNQNIVNNGHLSSKADTIDDLDFNHILDIKGFSNFVLSNNWHYLFVFANSDNFSDNRLWLHD